MAVEPDDADVHETLGGLLGQSGRPIEAEAHHRAALPGKDRHRGFSNLAIACTCRAATSRPKELLARRWPCGPDYATAHGNLMFSLNYSAGSVGGGHLCGISPWIGCRARRSRARDRTACIERLPGDDCALATSPPDFRQHAVALFAEPLLAAHDRTQSSCSAMRIGRAGRRDGSVSRAS